ncbi:hypothetical protein vBKpnAMK6_00128 [Klebsiella phage vB_Kpn_AM_K6]|uniref:Uncharacterized protein n=1 Tax=Klebsiella phage vB_Kpn_B01 TaxID=2736185 RepID=A0A6M5CDG4_9CAUD|nr:hypothetical protein IDEKMECI_00162 [Klebsiella phage vB_Kpn_B01]
MAQQVPLLYWALIPSRIMEIASLLYFTLEAKVFLLLVGKILLRVQQLNIPLIHPDVYEISQGMNIL